MLISLYRSAEEPHFIVNTAFESESDTSKYL